MLAAIRSVEEEEEIEIDEERLSRTKRELQFEPKHTPSSNKKLSQLRLSQVRKNVDLTSSLSIEPHFPY
jgi:hypothetical protein